MPLDTSIKKVLVIGSGPIVIGQAAEFDYAGAQACRILKEAGVNVVLCNSNPATIMTDQAMADEIYLEPLTTETIKRIIKKEKPDSLLAGLGGQTGLTLAMQLDKEGFLEEQGVRLLGTDAKAISRAEDRELFKEAMAEIGQPVIASDIAETVEGALRWPSGSVIPSSSVPPLLWAVPAAAPLPTKRSCGSSPKPVWMPLLLPRFWWSGPSSAGRRSSLRPCGTAWAT